ncbi:MAG: RES family NAD+ phosphorylase [Proteobacteria bacterium]|nr:RES family NAD+ phosphorylase [Pseudomonadota bacterium]
MEAQHIASTLRLVSNVEEQLLLERLLEASKPPLPAAAADLHYLLATPFRYASPLGSRFRSASQSGVWYGAEHPRTCCAELGYWRWRFLTDSPDLPALGPSPQTVFRARVQARLVDLTGTPFKRAHATWTHPRDYGPTQRFADTARAGGVEAIRYESVRDPEHAAAVAVLSPAVFRPRRPVEQQTWLLTVRRESVTWQRENAAFEFSAAPWA